MNATNTSSTKSPIVWRATLRPSDLFAVLYWLALLLAMGALWHCPVHWVIRVLLELVTLIGGIIIFLPTRQCVSIGLCEDGSWLLVENPNNFAHNFPYHQRQHHTGQLCSGCYRSMLLVVLAIKPAHGLTRYAVVWRDSLSARDFSALHIRLAHTPVHQLL